jgi:adenylylsulfate kinase
MTAFISPYLADREMARKLNKEGEFIEIYCRCALEECERRDTKGLYKKARAGEVKEFTGISAPYEEPVQPELILDTDKESLKESAGNVLAWLEKQGIIAPV